MAVEFGGFLDNRSFNLINMVVYNVSIITWFVYSFAYFAVRQSAANPLQTQRWEQGLVKVQHPVAADSLIPMFESMVERAINRSASADEPSPSSPSSFEPKAFSAAQTGTGSKFRG
jgi:hypothetical protein